MVRGRLPAAATLGRVLRPPSALVAAVLAACAATGLLLLRPDARDAHVPVIATLPGAAHGKAVTDPFAWTPERSDGFARAPRPAPATAL